MTATQIARLGYEKLAQRAIKLLMEIISRDNVNLLCGAELEFNVSLLEDGVSGAMQRVVWDGGLKRLRDYRPYREKVAEGAIFENVANHPYIDQSHYLSHFYDDGGNNETVFSHLSPNINPLRLAGAIETFKNHLVTDKAMSGESEISLSPMAECNRIRSLQISISLNILSHFHTPDFVRSMAPVIFDTLYIGFSNAEAMERYNTKYGVSSSQGSHEMTSANFVKRDASGGRMQFCGFNPNTNAYLAMTSVLAAIYYGMTHYKQRISPEESTLVVLGENQNYQGFFRNRFDHSIHFRGILNKLSGDEKLVDKLITQTLLAPSLLTPIGNETIRLR